MDVKLEKKKTREYPYMAIYLAGYEDVRTGNYALSDVCVVSLKEDDSEKMPKGQDYPMRPYVSYLFSSDKNITGGFIKYEKDYMPLPSGTKITLTQK